MSEKPIPVFTLGQLRRMTAELPDDTAVVFMEDVDTFYEVSDSPRYFPPAGQAPGALILEWGQEITKDHDMEPRLDEWHEVGEYLC